MLLVTLFAASPLAAKVDVDRLKATGYLNDYANVVDPADKAAIEQFCYQVQQELGVQIAVVTIDTVERRADGGLRHSPVSSLQDLATQRRIRAF